MPGKGIDVLIVAPAEDPALAQALASLLSGQGVRVHVAPPDENMPHAEQVIGLLPRHASGDVDRPAVRRMIARLRSIATASTSAKALTVVQFAGGKFGTSGPPPRLESAAASAFAKSIHLEYPQLRVRVLDLAASMSVTAMAEVISREASRGDIAFGTIGITENGVRLVPRVRLQQPAASSNVKPWGPDDVFLITGGGRGITAECALALARATGVRCALVGRSPHPADGGDDALARTLDRFTSEGLTARYYSCDITNGEVVHDLVRAVQADIGPITGIIHGAAVNRPRRIVETTIEQALDEVAPKVLGASNLFSATASSPPRLFVALTSVIGVTGMAGNAWYAFANEALDLLLRRFGADHPGTAVQSIAFSVWAETGMGARLGTSAAFVRRGIGAITVEEGTRRFLQLVLGEPATHQVVVAGPLGGLDTWPAQPVAIPSGLRFLERVVHSHACVALTARARLTPERDRYLSDHVYHGSRLFPAVFGLEAMAQAAVALVGDSRLEVVRLEDIRLERPIVVDTDRGVEIEVRAVVQERTPGEEIAIDTCVRSEQTGFGVEHFAARVILSPLPVPGKDEPTSITPCCGQPLPIEANADLYGGLLFQGPLFRRIGPILELDGDHVVLESRAVSPEDAARDAFASPGERLVLGDPFLRDVLLQAGQLTIPGEECLPVRIDRLERSNNSHSDDDGRRRVVAPSRRRDGRDHVAEVFVTDRTGRVLERLIGCRLRIVAERAEKLTAEDLVHPGPRDERLLRAAVADAWPGSAASTLPGIAYAALRGLHALPRDARRQLELPLIRRALEGKDLPVAWQEDGRPYFEGSSREQLDLSITHDEHGCLCLAGPGPLGCDLTPMQPRGREGWAALMGKTTLPLIDQLVQGGDGVDRAGARVWSAVEAARKATGIASFELILAGREGERVIFGIEGSPNGLRVVTRPLRLTLGPERIFAVTVPEGAAPRQGIAAEWHRVQVADDGPQGQPVQEMRFLVSFQDASTLARTVPASRYLAWMGRLREQVTSALLPQMIEQISSGEWGLVTNRAEVKIRGEATANDVVEMRFWTEAPETSWVEFFCDFHKVAPDGRHERLAFAEQRATWVRIIGPGQVRPAPFPAYLREYIAGMGPRVPGRNPRAIPNLSEPLHHLVDTLATPGDRGTAPWVAAEVVQTTPDDANLVGNIYFANYFRWQERTRDLWLHRSPAGEFLCLSDRIEYLREAMPFDRIETEMALRPAGEGVILEFHHNRLEPDGNRTRLAAGRQQGVWVRRDGTSTARTALPDAVKAVPETSHEVSP